MKILQAVSYFAPAWAYGGSVRAVYEISKRLVARGHEVAVVTTDVLDDKRRVKKKEDRIEGIKVYYFPTVSNWLSWHFKGFISPQMYFAMDRKVRNFDVIHLHEFYTFQGIITHHLCQKYRVPYVFSGHGSVMPEQERGRQQVKKFYTHFWGEEIIKDATFLIALTQKEKRQYQHFGKLPQKIKVVPNGIDLASFQNLPPKGQFRGKYGLSLNEKLILFVGRIYKIKGLDLLIKGLASFIKRDKKTTIVIVGPDAGSLKELKNQARVLKISRYVIFPGYLEGEKKLSAFVDADVYVQPSRSEGFPVSVLEAAACGLPLVVTRQSNVPEIEAFGSGIVVDASEEELKKATLRLLKDKRLRKKMGENSRKMVKEKFEWSRIVDKLEKVYAEAKDNY